MAYTRTTWTNREVEKPRTFTQTTNADGTITLTPAEGTIINAGTPIVAANMNKIEDQLVLTDSHINNTSNPHSVTAAQVGALSNFERFNIFMYRTTNALYTSGGFRTINFNVAENILGGAVNNAGDSVTVPRAGFALVTIALSLADITTTNGWIVANIAAGGKQFRVGGAHYTSNGNFSINGSAIINLAANDTIALSVACAEDFTIVGSTTEIRSFMAVRELV